MELPFLEPAALSRLTEKIQSNLQQSAKATTKPASKARAQNPKKTQHDEGLNTADNTSSQYAGRKRLRDGRIKAPDRDRKDVSLSRGRSGELGVKLNSDPKQHTSHKDLADGLPKPSVKSGKKIGPQQGLQSYKGSTYETIKMPQGGPKGPDDKKRASKGKPKNSVASDVRLNDEVLALGGTDRDFNLIGGVDSESEIEGSASENVSGKLLQGLQRLVRGLEVPGDTDESDVVSSDRNKILSEPPNPNDITLKPPRPPPEKFERKRKAVVWTPESLKFEPRAEWHTAELPQLPSLIQPPPIVPIDIIRQVHEYAKELLKSENSEYGVRNGSSSSAHQFYSTIMSAGTLSDKISALTLSVQESPVHNMRALENLVALAKKRSRGQAVEVLGALKDLLGPGSLLPSDRKLRPFATQPGLLAVFTKTRKGWAVGDPLPLPLKEVHLLYWAYEDWLKSTYFEILKIIETWCNDEIVFARGKAVEYIYELIRDKPEQEANLLRLLVNKLGDADRKIASKTSHNIVQLETAHPLMKPTIIGAIESDLLFRPGQSLHARYYAVITLNQTVLSTREDGVAKKLLDIYFSLFTILLGKKATTQPASTVNTVVTLNKKGERQGGGGAPGKKLQKKLAMESKNLTVDDELCEKMLSAILTGINRALPYAKTNDDFFDQHMDTLFKVTHSSNFNTSIQALMLIQQLCGAHQAASERFYRTLYESLLDPRLLTSSKQAMYLNLTFRALRADLKVKRVKAFAKRLLQVIALHQPPFACAVIYLLRELEVVFPNLQSFIDEPEERELEDEEHFRDVNDDREVDQPARAAAIQAAAKQAPHFYDGRKREPEYSNAETSCLWEIDPFLLHYHPSVALFASKLLTHAVMPAKPDLSMHTLVHFLDRFVYRNPKKVASGPRGSSIMQPLAGGDISGLLVSAQSKTGLRQPVNTEAFWKMEGGKVNADEVFFHKYFNAMGKGKEVAKSVKAKKNRNGDGQSGAEDNEEEIWDALVSSRPELEESEQSDDAKIDGLESMLGSEDEIDFQESDLGNANDQSLVDDEDDDITFDDDGAILGSDDEVPSDLDQEISKQMQIFAEEDAVVPEAEKRSKKRRKLKNLPMFASVDDYAAVLDEDEEDL